MDFRMLDASRLTWLSKGRVAYGGGKFMFQTPRATFSIASHPRFGPEALDVELHWSSRAGVALVDEFTTFVRSIETHVPASVMEGRRLVETLSFQNEMRLTAFENDGMLWFQKDGALTQPVRGATGQCMALLEFTGVWTSAASCGLKFKVLEIKEIEGDAGEGDAGEGDAGGGDGKYAFRDDAV